MNGISGMNRMKYSCDLIRDLLPLYCDEVCSRDSAEAVQEHIDTCENCRNIYMEMKRGALQETPLEASLNSAEYEKQQVVSMRQVKKKIKKKNTLFGTVGIIIGILLTVTIIRVMLVAGVIVFAVQEGKKDSYTSTDIRQYGTFEDFRGHSGLDVFPEQIDDSMEVHGYSYYYADTFLDPTAQIYLECSYDGDSYLKEIERLKGIQKEYKGKVQTVVYDTESFSYPAYVTINANDHCYEYALLLGDERIAYVFLQFIKEEEIVFPAEYLPKGYEETKDGYSIYIFYGEDGVGHCVFG